MKRSEINQHIADALAFMKQHSFFLPAFAHWSLADYAEQPKQNDIRPLLESSCGWDCTDFGSGDFKNLGLLLFTVRNGIPNKAGVDAVVRKPYCEKIMVALDGQVTPWHCHAQKTEDIIVRAGAVLRVKLVAHVMVDEEKKPVPNPLQGFSVEVDGVMRSFADGKNAFVDLSPGQSITLPPFLFHSFAPMGGKCLIGEVSTVNDDSGDNIFADGNPRFAAIEEDEPIRLPLVGDVENVFGDKKEQ